MKSDDIASYEGIIGVMDKMLIVTVEVLYLSLVRLFKLQSNWMFVPS